MPTPRTQLGWRGEEAALAYLEKRGWKLRQRHFRTRPGEIDLVMQDGQTLVFVEVKTRRSRRFGAPEEAVDERKLERMQAAAEIYLQRNQWSGAMRFDLVTVQDGRIQHIRNIQ